ncbi:hypothetical protein NQ317_019847 [Molorchus minor]|uniref:PHD-type domain-containing protein n=1 Tax=Molorchus minor TaxID=1323400 RepID=A0ABQ9JY60_9CUCU|nr:hypothetical protein NQ317_019847 [Molorchus minor]
MSGMLKIGDRFSSFADANKDMQKNPIALCCSGCLLWRHIRCAGLSRRPKSKLWFCRECNL